jgi:hypothetical protein
MWRCAATASVGQRLCGFLDEAGEFEGAFRIG